MKRIAFLAMFASFLQGDTIYLKDGSEMTGRMHGFASKGKLVVFEKEGGEMMKIRSRKVDRIVDNDGDIVFRPSKMLGMGLKKKLIITLMSGIVIILVFEVF